MNKDQTYYPVRHAPGLFWPIVLIGVGVIWLLTNLNVLSVNPWLMLWRLWPILLIIMLSFRLKIWTKTELRA